MGEHSAARETLEFARAKAYQLRPYWQAALYAWPMVLDDRVPSLACDRHGRIYANPDWVLAHGKEVTATALCHESWHLLADHYSRADAVSSPEHAKLVNRCQDAEANDGLRDEWERQRGMSPLPNRWCVLPEDVGGNPHEAWEKYYFDSLGSDTASTSQQASDCGSGSHGQARPWELGPPEQEGSRGLHEADIQTVREQVAKDTLAHVAKGRGTVPGHLIEWSNRVLRPKPVSWERLFDGLVRNALQLSRGYRHHTYMRPSRRSAVTDVIVAALRSPIPKIALVGDTSGSMSVDHLSLIRGTISQLCLSLGAKLTFFPVDAQVHGSQELTDGSLATMLGRGGTDMTVGIEHAMREAKPDAVVVATDCVTPWPREKLRVPLIVAAVEADESSIMAIPSWAKVVRIERTQK